MFCFYCWNTYSPRQKYCHHHCLQTWIPSWPMALQERKRGSVWIIHCRLKQVSLKSVSIFSTIHLSFNSHQFPSPCWGKTSRSVMLPPPRFTVGMVQSSILISSDQSTFFHVFEKSTIGLLVNSKHAALLFSLRNGFFSNHISINPSSVECTA